MEFILPQPLYKLNLIETYEYYDRPLLFTCESISGQKYLVNLIDADDISDTWFYVPISNTRFANVRSGKISVRDSILKSENNFVWEVITHNIDESKDRVSVREITSISEDELPDEDSYLNLNEGTLPDKIDTKTESLRSQRDVLDISLELNGSHKNEIEAEALGSVLLLTQELNYHVALNKNAGAKGKIPSEIKEKNRLNTVGFFAASFGVRLQSEATSGLLGHTDTTDSIKALVSLFRSTNDLMSLTNSIKDVNIRATKTYYQLLKKLNEKQLDINIEWASPADDLIKTRLERQKISDAINLLSQEKKIEQNEVEIVANLVGLDTDKKTFHLKTDENDHFSGKFLKDASIAVDNLNVRVKATLLEESEMDFISSNVNYRYYLKSLELI
ncbi:hypothetical protein P9858_00880 [Niallia circulans]|uniref:DUF6575 domain-containing protein n=1 Tax=Niallia circulans TaxID=1397 RepID=UPI002E1D2192|nr:hypothetical protein [Niallia circulans]